MHKQFFAVIVIIAFLVSGCDTNAGAVELTLNETSAELTETTPETVYMNNCGGKSDVKQTAERSKDIHVEYGGEFGVNKIVISGEVSAKYGETNATMKKIELTAPAGTNMEFNLEWTEKSWIGFVTAKGKAGEAPYKVSVPISVALISSRDLGCNTVTGMQPSQSDNTEPQTQQIPTTPEEAAARWGGQSQSWEKLSSNGWKIRGELTITIESGWRVDYTAPNGEIKSCGDTQQPGVYGPATVNVIEATLWYVPGESACPSWTIWSQSH